jgi:hypothetical protein
MPTSSLSSAVLLAAVRSGDVTLLNAELSKRPAFTYGQHQDDAKAVDR